MPAGTAVTDPAQPPAPAPVRAEAPAHARPHEDAWTWVAEYADGTAIPEMDAAGYDVRGMADVDVARVVRFTLVPCRPGLPTPTVQIDAAAGQRVIFTRRRRMVLDMGTGELRDRRTVHLLGWQQTVAGTNVKHVAYWFEDGSVLLSSDDQAI